MLDGVEFVLNVGVFFVLVLNVKVFVFVFVWVVVLKLNFVVEGVLGVLKVKFFELGFVELNVFFVGWVNNVINDND